MGTIKALDGVTVNINKGDVMAVIGPSGSGKSTFLRSLNLLEEPTGGAIIFNGIDITKKKYQDESGKMVKLDIDTLRQRMGMVFQHFNLFPHMTILENMVLAPMKVKGVSRADAEKKALELLDRVGLKDRADAYPIQLSGGFRQFPRTLSHTDHCLFQVVKLDKWVILRHIPQIADRGVPVHYLVHIRAKSILRGIQTA